MSRTKTGMKKAVMSVAMATNRPTKGLICFMAASPRLMRIPSMPERRRRGNAGFGAGNSHFEIYA